MASLTPHLRVLISAVEEHHLLISHKINHLDRNLEYILDGMRGGSDSDVVGLLKQIRARALSTATVPGTSNAVPVGGGAPSWSPPPLDSGPGNPHHTASAVPPIYGSELPPSTHPHPDSNGLKPDLEPQSPLMKLLNHPLVRWLGRSDRTAAVLDVCP